ncbi:MAG: amidohydrolase [Chloroflexota bacterium]
MSIKILKNAHIYNGKDFDPGNSVLVIDGSKIVEKGGNELVEFYKDHAVSVDLNGNYVLPGLVDAHMHLMNYALSLQIVDVETSTKEEALNHVGARASFAGRGEWVRGHGFQQNDWGGEFPAAAELDAVSHGHPVYLTGKSLHISWANSLALQMAGITASTQNPPNGRIVKDSSGNPTGILLETAMELVDKILPVPSAGQTADSIEKAIPNLWKHGLTGVHDFDYRPDFIALQILDNAGRLKIRITKSIPLDLLPSAAALGLRTGFGSEFLRIGSIKVFVDGALGPRTAAMFSPYANEPNNVGILNMDGEQFFEYGRQAADAGLSMTGHAIGDRAVHEILNGFEQLRAYEKENGIRALRHRIEHVQIVHPDDISRLAKLGIIASMQPIHATSDMVAAEKYWGERTAFAYAWRSHLDAGTSVAFGSDAPVEYPNPFWGIHAAITRRRSNGEPGADGWGKQQRITIQEAINGYTTGAAYAAGQEHRQGKLQKDFDADLIVLDKNPITCDPDELLDMKPKATMVSGDWVWQA